MDHPPTPDAQPDHPAEPVAELETVAAGLQASKTEAAQRRRAARDAKTSGGLLLIIRLLTALAVLAMSIMSYVAIKKTNPPHWLLKWGVLEPPPKSPGAYKNEMIVLMVLSGLSLLVFLADIAAAQFFAFALGMTVMGIVTGNLLDDDLPHKLVAYAMTQTGFITTWICLGLGLICAMSSVLKRATPQQAGVVFVVGGAITGIAVAILAADAPSLGVSGAHVQSVILAATR